MRLKDKAALVTGAASGIGRACAAALAREGARVLACDVDETGLAETAKLSPAIVAQALDVTQAAAWAAAVAEAEARFGGLHVLVNNAGLCVSAGVMDTTLGTWRRQNAVNLDGVFLGVQAALPLLERSGGGAIINISSVAGLKGIAGLAGYCASKGGVRLFTKAVALECAAAGKGVRVNSIHPGAIETPIWVKMRHGGALPEGSNTVAEEMDATRAGAARATPLGFAGAPDDIAEGVVYLASDAARFVTGAELVIDGGVFAG
jgi:NAD(P)-dependent dehydrogenase (short-subunit alcohol dehydrogenase family)